MQSADFYKIIHFNMFSFQIVIMKDFLRKTWKNQKKFVNLPAEIKKKMMKTIPMEQLYIEIPSVEVAFLRTLANKMGWSLKRKKKSGIQQALEDVDKGNVHEAKSVEDLMKQLEA